MTPDIALWTRNSDRKLTGSVCHSVPLAWIICRQDFDYFVRDYSLLLFKGFFATVLIFFGIAKIRLTFNANEHAPFSNY